MTTTLPPDRKCYICGSTGPDGKGAGILPLGPGQKFCCGRCAARYHPIESLMVLLECTDDVELHSRILILMFTVMDSRPGNETPPIS